MPAMLHIPDTLANWPFERRISPYHEEVSHESAERFRSFSAFDPAGQKVHDAANIELLAALTYPTHPRELYKAACMMMHLFFVFDDYTDTLDTSGVRRLADISIAAMHDPSTPRTREESVIGEMVRQFWIHVIQHATPNSRARFELTWSQYTDSVVEQARDREHGPVRTVEEHLAIRRLTIGAEPCYAMAQLGLDIPEEAYNHQLLQTLRKDITDVIIYDNDLVSYNKEQANEVHLHNLIALVIHEHNMTLDEAVLWVADRHKQCTQRILVTAQQILALSFRPEIDADLAFYLDLLMNWPRAHDCWNFEGGRYFGSDGLRVKKERTVTLLPKRY